MREIKFRAWHKEYRKMLLVYSLGFNYAIHPDTICSDEDGSHDTWTNEELVIMQFTGLKDKNGEEIYEGDILYCFDDPGSHHRIYWDNIRCGWNDERLEDGDSNTSYYGFESFRDCKVIGNIYKNPELLK